MKKIILSMMFVGMIFVTAENAKSQQGNECNNAIRYGDKITLKSVHNKFLVAERDGSANANRPEALNWETFFIYRADSQSYNGEVKYGDPIRLKSIEHHKFLVGEENGLANANRPSAGLLEQFRIIYSSNPATRNRVVSFSDKISLLSQHNKYLVAEEDGRANADRTNIGSWEQWTILGEKGAKPCRPPIKVDSCLPNDNQVTLFAHTNFTGTCLKRNIGNSSDKSTVRIPNSSTERGGFTNNGVYSLKVGKNVKVLLCRQVDYRDCNTYSANRSRRESIQISYNSVLSMRVMRKNDYSPNPIRSASRFDEGCRPRKNQITLFVGANYTGRCYVKSVRNYDKMRLTIRSIMVARGAGVIIFQRENNKGEYKRYYRNVPNITGNQTNVRSMLVTKK